MEKKKRERETGETLKKKKKKKERRSEIDLSSIRRSEEKKAMLFDQTQPLPTLEKTSKSTHPCCVAEGLSASDDPSLPARTPRRGEASSARFWLASSSALVVVAIDALAPTPPPPVLMRISSSTLLARARPEGQNLFADALTQPEDGVPAERETRRKID